MLASQSRLRKSRDFSATVKHGVRAGSKTIVVHARMLAETPLVSTQVGFVVSKAVGNAVGRNRVKRRLRHLSRAELESTPDGLQIVVRALPSAAAKPDRLAEDFTSSWHRAVNKAVKT